jgi:hypothetical protein
MQTTVCEKCGKILKIGEWPLCGGRNNHGFPIQGLTLLDDSIPGGETIENLAPTPITFYSKSDKRRYLKEHGIREKVRHVGEQGSDKSRHTQRWI